MNPVCVFDKVPLDLNGNLINDGQRQYDWDAANRLIRVSNLFPDASGSIHSSEFSYDGWDRWVEIKEKQGLQTVAERNFVYDNDDNLLEERDQRNNVAKRFYDGGVQVVSGSQAGTYFYLIDHLGSVRGVLDSGGNVVASIDYDMWGNASQTAGTFTPDIGYAGYFEHQFSGLKLTEYRAYSPQLGRWINRDPIQEYGGVNLYGYVTNDPIDLWDSLGLYCLKPGVPPPSPEMDKLVRELEARTGVKLTITSTTDNHPVNSEHGQGRAVDLRYIDEKTTERLLRAASNLGAQFGLDEKKHPSKHKRGNHVHIQSRPNNGPHGKHGDLPDPWTNTVCPNN